MIVIAVRVGGRTTICVNLMELITGTTVFMSVKVIPTVKGLSFNQKNMAITSVKSITMNLNIVK